MGASEGRARSWWGWGWADLAMTDHECVGLGEMIPGLADSPVPVPAMGDLVMRAPRLSVPALFSGFMGSTPADRAAHTYGKAYRDVIRALRGHLDVAPDLVAYPRDEADVVDVLDWAGTNDVAVVPYGAGSSVVGGTECRGDAHSGVLSVDLSRLDRVLEVDTTSRAARIQAGVLGPALEAQLKSRGMTLRHFPQSFEFSTLGGWLATRSAGHYATLHTHIDDFVESIRAVTPAGVYESWRLPASGAGPSPDRLLLGSEGILGVITEAWIRIQDRPTYRRSASIAFGEIADALRAVRSITQAGLHPANCRLLDPGEAALSGVASSGENILVLGVESAHHPVDHDMDLLLELALDHSGAVVNATEVPRDGSTEPIRDEVGEAWRSSFLRMPYLRDGLARMSAIVETFETACTWDRVDALYDDVRAEMGDAIVEVTGAPGIVNCRFTHSYPDGTAPYFTIVAAGRRGSEVAMWDELKGAAMEVLGRHGATVTHHHAVGRDHRPGYDRQRPDLFAAALAAAKQVLDPAGILNPGVLIG